MKPFDLNNYAPAIAGLLRDERLAPLGPGTPNEAARPLLKALTVDKAFGSARGVIDPDMAACCLAGLWLYHDFQDESHRLCQDIDTTSGSFWHGIVHRREPDAGNAKYWFRRVGAHPVLARLVEQAAALGYQYVDPFSFVDECERVRGTGTAVEATARQVQHLEWCLLFDHCDRAAVGSRLGNA